MPASLKPEEHEKAPHTAHGEAQRKALVRAAYDLIAEKGFEGLRTRDVAEKAGMNVATLHYYFKSKEDLIRGVGDLLREQFIHTMHPSFQNSSKGPLEELRRELMDLEYQLETIPEAFIVMFELHMRSLRDPAIKDVLEKIDAGWQAHISGYLTAGVKQGIFRADLDIPIAATSLMAFVKGAMVQLIYNPQTFPVSRVSAEIERWLTEHATPGTHHQMRHETHHNDHHENHH